MGASYGTTGLSVLLLSIPIFALAGVSIGVQKAEASTSGGVVLGVQLSDTTCGSNDVGPQQYTPDSVSGGSSAYAYDAGGADFNCARIYLDRGTNPLPTDVRFCVTATKRSPLTPGAEACTPWASAGGGISAWALDGKKGDIDGVRLRVETRAMPVAGQTISNLGFMWRQSNGSACAKTGAWGTAPNGGWSGWITDSDRGDSQCVQIQLTGTVVAAPTLPDLTAGAITPVTATAGTAVSLRSTISNSGAVSAAPGTKHLFQSATSAAGANATDLGTYTRAAAIVANGSFAATLAYTFPSAGTFYVRACADKSSSADTGTVTESNESNNCGPWTAVTVAAPPQPDLTASAITPTAATAGTAVTLSSTISNTNVAATGGGFQNLFQRATNASGANATDIGTYNRATNLAKNGSFNATLSYPFPSAGTYYVRACADKSSASNNGTIAESNENNNCGAWTAVTVAPAPQADLTAGALSPSTATVDQAISFTAPVSNPGNAGSGSFPTRFQIANAAITQTLANAVSGYITLAAGASQNVSASYTFSNAGTYNVRACANQNAAGTNIVTESNYGNNCGDWTTVTVTAAAPTCTLTSAGPTAPTTLAWSSTNATSCTGGGFSTGGATSGSVSVDASGPYTLSCTGTGGSCSKSVIVGAPACTNPQVILTAAPDRVGEGQTTTLTYSALGVNGPCTLSGPNLSLSIPASSCSVPQNTATTPAITAQATYTLACGSTQKSVIVNLIPSFVEF